MPRIMYIPETGQAVYVVAKLSSNPPKRAPAPPIRTSTGPRPLSSTRGRVESPVATVAVGPPSPALSLPTTVATTVAPTERATSPAPTYYSRQAGLRAAAPPSLLDEDLPLSGFPPSTSAANKNQRVRRKPLQPPPPEEDHVPDEAELERRRRGDAQPQLLSPHDMIYKFSSSVTGTTPQDTRVTMDKVLLGSPLRKRESRASI